ncbi:MAG: hypothetical protein UT48_C0001G0064 [Parcubacteria group bacterium GW2011_GWE2_39_37]|uniref:Uncharacterized protein n=1 Tax=Candidatus Falkowbacteria bacterium GW2011_GWF2_39_8 TaxID=1618642 RepID=A0A0G0SGE9_9BACT|nr:MAG: hypothetical protein UT48_C0001G0064 [Parcubacteria group bacterium GW2011_GWE2_39_37]KKR33785.1 MAG: hypothetical protein UT64_C0003G0006 [Candidatus Falkowbacteria bacterium GW2011_GWF2_39_8]
MKHVWSILCQTSIRDQDTNRTSIINAMDSIGFIVDRKKLETKKFIPANLEIVSLWDNSRKQIKEFLIKVELMNPSKKVLISSELPVLKPTDESAPNEMRSVTTRMAINLLPVTITGQYYFQVSQKLHDEARFSVVAKLPLEVKIKFKEENKK